MSDYKVLRIDKGYDAILKQLIQSSTIKTEKEYTEAMIDFFKNSGLEPTNDIKTVPGEISKLRNVVVGFIREQEKKKINPLIEQTQELAEAMIKFVNEDALTKEDLKKFMLNSPSKVQEKTGVEGKNAKELFTEFVSKMESGIRGYSIDKKTLKHYENLFNSL